MEVKHEGYLDTLPAFQISFSTGSGHMLNFPDHMGLIFLVLCDKSSPSRAWACADGSLSKTITTALSIAAPSIRNSAGKGHWVRGEEQWSQGWTIMCLTMTDFSAIELVVAVLDIWGPLLGFLDSFPWHTCLLQGHSRANLLHLTPVSFTLLSRLMLTEISFDLLAVIRASRLLPQLGQVVGEQVIA